MTTPDDRSSTTIPSLVTLPADGSTTVHLAAIDHGVEPSVVVAAAVVAYRGPGPRDMSPRLGVAVSDGSRVAPLDLPVAARHSSSGLVVRVAACVDAPIDALRGSAPCDIVVAAGEPAGATGVLASVPVVLWCRSESDGRLTLELVTSRTSTALTAHLQRFAEFLVRFAGAGRAPIGGLQIVSDAERIHLEEWNATGETVVPATLVDLVEMGLAREPDRAAIVTPDGVVSHADVDCLANRVARALLAAGVRPGAVVGVLCAAAPAAMVAALAVLRAGGAVLMLSDRASAAEISARIAAARATRVVSDTAVAAVVPPWIEIIGLDDEDLQHHPDEPITADDGAVPGHLWATAEVTVGDDRIPLIHSHAALVNRLNWTLGDWEASRGPGENQVLLPADAARLGDVCDALWPLVIGATAHTTVGHGIDRLATDAGSVVEAGGAAFRVIGDERPGWNVEAYVLDAQLRLVPPGAVGELYLGGAQVALGSPRDIAGTACRFVANPFRPGERMVRVGSVVARGQTLVGDVDVLRTVIAAVGVSGTVRDEIRPARSGNPTP